MGLSQKTVFTPGRQKMFSFFNSNKKLQSNFLLELKKENKISCWEQRAVFAGAPAYSECHSELQEILGVFFMVFCGKLKRPGYAQSHAFLV